MFGGRVHLFVGKRVPTLSKLAWLDTRFTHLSLRIQSHVKSIHPTRKKERRRGPGPGSRTLATEAALRSARRSIGIQDAWGACGVDWKAGRAVSHGWTAAVARGLQLEGVAGGLELACALSHG